MNRLLTSSLLTLCVIASQMILSCGPSSKYVPAKMTPREVEWESFHALEHLGDLEGAADGFKQMCAAEQSDVRACHDYSRVLFDMARYQESIAAAEDFVKRFSNSALAPAAAQRIARIYKILDEPKKGVAVLKNLAALVVETDIWDSLEYQAAQLCRAASDSQCELDLLLAIVEKGRWSSQLWDNAIWRSIQLYFELGDRLQEKKLLKQLIASREKSYLIASYNSPYHDDAILRLGRINFDEGNLKEAYKLFKQLMEWKTSRMRDDGHVWGARVLISQNKRKRACRLLAFVINKLPAANTRKEAIKLSQEINCDNR